VSGADLSGGSGDPCLANSNPAREAGLELPDAGASGGGVEEIEVAWWKLWKRHKIV
jgi:hypothetical protein